jgi:hypothetical protein
VDEAHLQSYLSEFAVRSNRRRSTSRGMVFYRVLELAGGQGLVRYRDLVIDPQPKGHPARSTRDRRPPTEPGPAPSGTPLARR